MAGDDRREWPELLNASELQQRLCISEAKFRQVKRDGHLRMFEVSRPLGQRRYSRVLVERYLAGESASVLGGRRRP